MTNEGNLEFSVKTTGLAEGSFLGGEVQTGMLAMDNGGNNSVNFRTYALFPGSSQNSVQVNGVVSLSIPVGAVQGPAYLRIVPDNLYGQIPPGFAGSGAGGRPAFGPCRRCADQGQNYTQPY